MKKLCLLLLCSLFAAACDRLTNEQSAKLTIQLPAVTSLGIAPTTSSSVSAEPTGFTGDRPINCYMVAVGGPEDGFHRNVCQRTDGTTTFAPRYVGPWSGAIAAGGTVSIDVPSGKDRVVFVVGFYAADMADCRDFKAYGFPDGTLSDPYLLGELGQQEFKAGDTVDLPVSISFDTNNRFDKCTGPDFPGESKTVPTQLTIEKNFFPYNMTIESICQSASVRLTDARGREGAVTVPTTVEVQLDGAPLTVYPTMSDCQSTTKGSTTKTIAAGDSQTQIVFYPPAAAGHPSYTLSAKATSFTDGTKLFANVVSTAKSIELAGPDRILPDMCYPYVLNLKYVNGGASTESSGFQINYDDAKGFKFYSNAGCTLPLASPLSLPSSSAEYPLWGKMTSASLIDLNLVATTYADSHPLVIAGGGSTNIISVEIRGDNNGPQYGVAYPKPYTVELFNEKRTAVTTPGLFPFTFLNAGVKFDYGAIAGVSSPITNYYIPAGAHSNQFYIKPRVSGLAELGTSGTGVVVSTPYLINVAP